MTALFILCLALVSVAQAETWRGQDRCWFAGQVVLVRAKYGLTVDSAGAGRPGEDSHRLPVDRLMPVGTEAAGQGARDGARLPAPARGFGRQARAGYRLA